MFQIVSIIALLATLIGISVHWVLVRVGQPQGVVRTAVQVFSLLLIEQKSSLLGALKKLCYIVATVCFVVLVLTGFWPVLVRGQHISGWLMMVHATFAPVFALCLAILAITWAGENRLTAEDCPCVPQLLRRVTRLRIPVDERPCRWSQAACKVAFWLLMFLSLPLVLSIVVSMFPLLGTDWQHITLALHRWTSLAFVIVAIIHTYLAIRLRAACDA